MGLTAVSIKCASYKGLCTHKAPFLAQAILQVRHVLKEMLLDRGVMGEGEVSHRPSKEGKRVTAQLICEVTCMGLSLIVTIFLSKSKGFSLCLNSFALPLWLSW